MGTLFRQTPNNGYPFPPKWPLKMGTGLEASAAHPRPNNIWVPPPPRDVPARKESFTPPPPPPQWKSWIRRWRVTRYKDDSESLSDYVKIMERLQLCTVFIYIVHLADFKKGKI